MLSIAQSALLNRKCAIKGVNRLNVLRRFSEWAANYQKILLLGAFREAKFRQEGLKKTGSALCLIRHGDKRHRLRFMFIRHRRSLHSFRCNHR
jgi:hypothetical protein